MGLKYTKAVTEKLIADYQSGISVAELATSLDVAERSVIAKLSSLGVYQSKRYLNKRGEVPVLKESLLEVLALQLCVPLDRLESLEKVNKSVLSLLIQKTAKPAEVEYTMDKLL